MASEAVVKCIEELLDGYVSHTTIAYAKTLQQDLMVEDSSAIAKVPFAYYQLCGGAQYRRFMQYFTTSDRFDTQWVKTKVDRDAIVTQIHQIREIGVLTWELIISKFAREGLKGEFGLDSSIELLCEKSSSLILQLAEIACECLGDDVFRTDFYSSYYFLRSYPQFKSVMLEFISKYVRSLQKEADGSMKNLLSSISNTSGGYASSVQKLEILDVNSLILRGYVPAARPLYNAYHLTGYKCDHQTQITSAIIEEVQKGVEIVFVALAKDLVDTFIRIFDSLFKIPLFRNLSVEMVKLEQSMEDKDIESMFNITEKEIEYRKEKLDQQVRDIYSSLEEVQRVINLE